MEKAGRVAIAPQEEWNPAKSYKKLDAVMYDDTMYIAKKNTNPGDLPTDESKWFKSVSAKAVLPMASDTVLGGVKIDDDTIGIDEEGFIHAKNAGTVKSVNGIEPDKDGDIYLETVPSAENLTADDAHSIHRALIIGTTGGNTSIGDGDAWLSFIQGGAVKNGEAPEEWEEIKDSLSYTLNKNVFREKVDEISGIYIFLYDGTSWKLNNKTVNLEDYGITVSGISEEETAEAYTSDEEMIVTVIPGTFGTAVNHESGFYSFVYNGSSWTIDEAEINLADYGISAVGDPEENDVITIIYTAKTESAEYTVKYTAEDRGIIVTAHPTQFVSTGWNLYRRQDGYARVAGGHRYKIGGSYSSVAFSATLTGEQIPVEIVDGFFVTTQDGYIFVVNGGSNTYIYLPWTDWLNGYQGDFEEYTETVVTIPALDITGEPLPFVQTGLCAVGAVRDEINFDLLVAISRIERMSYTKENLRIAQESGRHFIVDTNWIYIVREEEITYDLSPLEYSAYTASDHGIEYFEGTEVPVVAETLYGRNLKDYLRHDVPNKFNQIDEKLGTLGTMAERDVEEISTNENTLLSAESVGVSVGGQLVDLQSEIDTLASQGVADILYHSSETKSWVATTVSNLNQYRFIAVYCGTSGGVVNSSILPISLFKTICTTPVRALTSRNVVNTTAYTSGAYYVNDTTIGIYNENSSTGLILGIK